MRWLIISLLLAVNSVSAQKTTSAQEFCEVVWLAPERRLAPGEMDAPRPDDRWLLGDDRAVLLGKVKDKIYWLVLMTKERCAEAPKQTGYVASRDEFTPEKHPDSAAIWLMTVQSGSEIIEKPMCDVQVGDVVVRDRRGAIIAPRLPASFSGR